MPAHPQPGRPGRTLLVVLVGLLALAAGWLIWLGLRPGGQPDPQAGQEVAAAFLRQLELGQAQQAWQSTTAEFKSARGQEAFVGDVAARAYLKQPLDFVSLQQVQVGSEARSEFLFRAKTGETVRIIVAREAGEWKVDRWIPQ